MKNIHDIDAYLLKCSLEAQAEGIDISSIEETCLCRMGYASSDTNESQSN